MSHSSRLRKLEDAQPAPGDGKIDSDGTLLFRCSGDYTKPRCSLWHFPENWTKYAAFVRTIQQPAGTGRPQIEACDTRCPFVPDVGPVMMGSGDTEPVERPCGSCEWFKIVPKM
jgi:hypothetical protein